MTEIIGVRLKKHAGYIILTLGAMIMKQGKESSWRHRMVLNTAK